MILPLGYSTVSEFCGHGIGSVFHTTPNVIHARNNEPGRMEVRLHIHQMQHTGNLN